MGGGDLGAGDFLSEEEGGRGGKESIRHGPYLGFVQELGNGCIGVDLL